MKVFKKWMYYIFLIAAGILYLTYVDHWKVYADIYSDVREYFAGLPEDIEIPDIAGTIHEFPDSTPVVSLPGEEVLQEEPGAEVPEAEVIVSEGETEEPAAEAGPSFGAVDDSYFADAVFIGDSRTVGLADYGGLEGKTTFYASTGLSVYTVFSSKCIAAEGKSQKMTIEEALSLQQFGKVYICLGINELGTGNTRTFVTKYRSVLERLRELQPEAVIYVEAIPKVTEKRSNQGDYVTNESIEDRNNGLRELAAELGFYYLDVNPAICDEDGNLNSEYTHDGVHLKAKYVSLWIDFLKNNALLP